MGYNEVNSQEYQDAMDELTMFTQVGKNEHDDAPDGLVQLIQLADGGTMGTVEPTRHPMS